jgi:hypothetical protein
VSVGESTLEGANALPHCDPAAVDDFGEFRLLGVTEPWF